MQHWHDDDDVLEATVELLTSLCDASDTRRRLQGMEAWWRIVQAYGSSTTLVEAASRENARAMTYVVVRGCFGGARWVDVAEALRRHIATLKGKGGGEALGRLGDVLRAIAKAAAAVMKEDAVLFAAAFVGEVKAIPAAAVQAQQSPVANSILKYLCELLDAVGSMDIESAVPVICPAMVEVRSLGVAACWCMSLCDSLMHRV